jgi:hypothetical protein
MFTYYLQYIFATYLSYNSYKQLAAFMKLDQTLYFAYALPAIAFLFAGVIIFHRSINFTELVDKIDGAQAFRLGMILLVISYFFDFVPLAGLSSFTNHLKFSAAFFFLFSNFSLRYFLIFGLFFQLLLDALVGGIFIDFFVYLTYLFFFICLRYQFPFLLKASFILLAVPVLITIQSLKGEYRRITWRGREQQGVDTFSDLAEKRLNERTGISYWETKGVVSTVGRLTQGWHLGLTLRWVPLKVPFEHGKELVSDVTASLLPRFFFPNKKIVGEQDKFTKYTGHPLSTKTSMTIGVIGDFYINFGVIGSFVALFIFGALLSKGLILFSSKYILPSPINIVWLTFIGTYLMRANNDFYMVFNSILKGFIIFLAVNYFESKIWPTRIKEIDETQK